MAFQSNVRSFTDLELITRVRGLSSFTSLPTDHWMIAVRSDEDAADKFDDKAYLFKGDTCEAVYQITTNAGKSGLIYPQNEKGCAVLKSDEIYYDAWQRAKHRNKILAYTQRLMLPVYRDNDKDARAEETGTLDWGIFGINIHPSTYLRKNSVAREFIGPWSIGCLVFAKGTDFEDFMRRTEGQGYLTVALLKEWGAK